MASGSRLPPQPWSSAERRVRGPGERQEEKPARTALCWPPGHVCAPAETLRWFPEVSRPGGARLSTLPPRAPKPRAAGNQRVADLALQAAQGPQPTPPPSGLERPVFLGDPGEPLAQPRVLAFLSVVLGREARLWRGGQAQVPVPSGPSGHLPPPPRAHGRQTGSTCTRAQDEICEAFQEVVKQFLRLQNVFLFSPSTFNLALTILNRLLVSVKIRKKILHCVTITSLRLAAKVNEEDEVIPRVKDFIQHYGSEYTPNELRRMELAILDKLHWELYFGTPLNFLNIFHILVVLGWPHVRELMPQRNPSLHVASLTRQLQHCMAGHQLLQFKGSTLALVIITLELERLMPDWWTPISDLLKKAQVSIEQFCRCKELVKQQLRNV